VRRADQTIVAVLVLGGLIAVGVWWYRHGGASGTLVEHDQLPQREAKLLVDINTADVAELSQLPLIGPALSERIIAYRDKHGRFEKLEDLKAIPGIGPKTLDAVKRHLLFETSASVTTK
jgi:competence ComEA-like helix-hairpin-helix protein